MAVDFELTGFGHQVMEFHQCAGEDIVGFIPLWLDPDNPAGAVEQLNKHYSHGGGWHPFRGFKLSDDHTRLTYPGDPDMRALARMKCRDEEVIMFQSSWVAVVQPDGSFEVARMD